MLQRPLFSMGTCVQFAHIGVSHSRLYRTVRAMLTLVVGFVLCPVLCVIQEEGQNADHRWICLWSLCVTRLDDRLHYLFREAEEAERVCQSGGIQEP